MSESPTRRPRRVLLAGAAIALVALAMGGALVALQFAAGPAGAPPLSEVRATLAPRLDECASIGTLDGSANCYEALYLEVIGDRADADRRLPLIDTTVVDHSLSAREACHNVMHWVGRDYAARHALELADLQYHLPRDNSPICSAGFTHGILTHLGKKVVKLDPSEVRAACYAAKTRMRRLGCIHGLGHAYLRTSPDIDYALDRCARLGTRDDLDCAQGVFHDYWFAARGQDMAKTSVVKERNAFRLCASVRARFAEGCWFRAARVVQNVPPMRNAGDLSAACAEFTGANRRGCILALAGSTRPTEVISDGRRQQLLLCGDLADADEALACAKGITTYEDITRRGAKYGKSFLAACATLPAPADAGCAVHFGRVLGASAKWNMARTICPTLPQSIRAACARGVATRNEVIGNLG